MNNVIKVGKSFLRQRTKNRTLPFTIIVVLLCVASFINSSFANDTVVEITPKGLQLKIEENISIEREDLYISLEKIEVFYIFKNHSDKDVTVEVAFPVPPYRALSVKNQNYSHYPVDFSDFIVEVDGKKTDYKKDVKALVDGKDYTDILNNLNVSIENFGEFDFSKPHSENEISKLNNENKKRLNKLKILNIENKVMEPNWTVDIKYHWTQTFPANSTLNIKHSYKPYYGSEYSLYHGKESKQYEENWINNLNTWLGTLNKIGCLDQNTKKSIEKRILSKAIGEKPYTVLIKWVSYILTTANNWKKPIKEFHLTLEKPEDSIMSLCFDNKLIKISPIKFESHIENYIPKKDLKNFFISGE